MLDLAELFRDNGLKVDTRWYRTSSTSFAPVGAMLHHTAGADSNASMNILRDGRAGVPGPLCNVGVRKDGTLVVVTNTRANHAGNGSSVVLNETRRNIAPSDDAGRRGLSDNTNGNGYYYGFEVVNLGNGSDPYPAAQLEATFKAAALICKHYGWPAERVIHHREWTRRKIDMSWRGDTRQEIRNRLTLPAPEPLPEPEEDYIMKIGDKGPEVAQVFHLVNRVIALTGGWHAEPQHLTIGQEYTAELAERVWHSIARAEQWVLHHPIYSDSAGGTILTPQTQAWLVSVTIALNSGALQVNQQKKVDIDDRFEPLSL